MPLAMRKKVFITAAVTGSGGTQERSDKVPRSPEQIARPLKQLKRVLRWFIAMLEILRQVRPIGPFTSIEKWSSAFANRQRMW